MKQNLFIYRILRNAFFGILFIGIALYVGMLGYHGFEKLSWIDSFLNASMILGGMGPVDTMHTRDGKIFAGCYALFSGLGFIFLMGLVFAPIIHHIFLKIHLESKKDIK